MDGIRLNDSASLEAYGIDKQKVVEEITRAYAHQIYVDGFFNGDPHPGTLTYMCSHLNVNKCRLKKTLASQCNSCLCAPFGTLCREFSRQQGTSSLSNFA